MKRKSIIMLAMLLLFVVLSFGICLLLYKYTTIFEKNQWTITQYGPRNMNSSFYNHL